MQLLHSNAFCSNYWLLIKCRLRAIALLWPSRSLELVYPTQLPVVLLQFFPVVVCFTERRKNKRFLINQAIAFLWPSRPLEWGYVLIFQFHSDCAHCPKHNGTFLDCRLHIVYFCNIGTLPCTGLQMVNRTFLPVATIKRVHFCTLGSVHTALSWTYLQQLVFTCQIIC